MDTNNSRQQPAQIKALVGGKPMLELNRMGAMIEKQATGERGFLVLPVVPEELSDPEKVPGGE